MKLVVTRSQQTAARLKLKLAKELTPQERSRLSAIADAPQITRAELDGRGRGSRAPRVAETRTAQS